MPKKFRGENSKSVEARARKAAQKEAETERQQRQLEDEYWKEDDKNVLKKLHRKEEKEKKKSDQLERKKESQRLADEELASIKSSAAAAGAAAAGRKLTRAEIDAHLMTATAAEGGAGGSSGIDAVMVDELPIEENVNRLTVDGLEARSVDEAIKLLSTRDSTSSVDLHPEKRVRAAYLTYEQRRLADVKADNPNLRLSQIKQIIKKDWNKSPDNPLNQRLHAAH